MQEDILKITRDTSRAHEYFLNKLSYMITPGKLKIFMEKNLDSFLLIDVRDYEDYIEGHIPYAVHVPHHALEENMKQFSKDKINIIYADSLFCAHSTKCAVKLTKDGYPVMELKGGFRTWERMGFEIIKTASEDCKTFEEPKE